MRTSVSLSSIGALIDGTHDNPFEVLGPHELQVGNRRAVAVRAYLPNSKQAWIINDAHETPRPMRRIHPAGVYEAICPQPADQAKHQYQIRMTDHDGAIHEMHDPYAFPPLFGDDDFYLFGEGTHERLFERLGAQKRTIDGVSGTNFAVWAPNAKSVSVVGDFNGWDSRHHALRKHIPSGIWEIFLPGIGPGSCYKFKVRDCHDHYVDKADPYGFAAEVPPRTGSVVADLDEYQWCDSAWMGQRHRGNGLDQPISIYEVHLGSWRRDERRQNGWMSYRDIAAQLVQYCLEMGFTHIELLPVSEHPFSGSWGYQTVGLYAATSRHGSPSDLMYLVDHCHQNGIGVILDWVPAHFPKDEHGLRRFDGTALYEHADPRQGEHPDWGTLIFNYGRNEVRNYLIANALFWLEKYHIDGLRVDAVASMLYLDYSREDDEWVANEHGGRENLAAIEFLKQFNERSHLIHPGVLTIAEESTAWGGVSRPTTAGGLGFSIKWNMGWMNDTLRYMRHDPIHRGFHHDELTFSLIYAFTENFALPFSHDEVVHGKGSLLDQMPGDLWQKFANLRLLYSYMFTHPGKKLLFMGSEWGQWTEWNHEDGLQWDLLQWDTHRGIKKLVSDLNALYRREKALHQLDFEAGGFEWIDCQNAADSVLSYIRRSGDPNDFVVVTCNFTPVTRTYRLALPVEAWYEEIFNSDSEYYGGTNAGNHPGVAAEAVSHHGRPCSAEIQLPPLGVAIFKPQRSP